MMKTALSIVQSVRKRLNLPNITALAGATDPDELQMIELLYAVCEELRAARCWTQMKRKFTFSTEASRSLYPLPQDFYAPIMRTHWNTTESLALDGPRDDTFFAGKLYGAEPASYNFAYRIFGGDEIAATTGGQIELSPTPDSVVVCNFEYYSRSFILPRSWTTGAAFGAGSYCNSRGNIYVTTAGGTTGATMPSHSTGSVSDGAVTWTFFAGPYEAVTADTDLVIFDDDLVKLGLRAKWLEEAGGDYAEAKAEFGSRIDRAVARYRGSHVGTFGGPEFRARYRVQRGSWSL